MTDEQIIKALECCIKPTSDCDNCPYYGYDDLQCFDMSKRDALDLLNQQQAEIARLKEELEIRNQKRASIFEISNAYERGRAEAIKEFAERLKETISNSLYQYWNEGSGGYYLAEDVPDDINNLVKEMVGETDV